MKTLSIALALVGYSSTVARGDPMERFGKNVQHIAIARVTGSVQANFIFTYTNDVGVIIQVADLYNFTNTTLGSYSYHIHTNPVDDTANTTALKCGAALAHLDPTNVTENIVCDPDLPSYCQLGDLSGKHGKINATESGEVESFDMIDPFLRFYPEEFSLLGRSIVIHGFNKTRLACGNIISTLDGTLDPATIQASNKSSTYQTSYPSAAPPAPTTTVTLGTGTTINSAGLSSAGLKVPISLPPYSEAPDIVLTTKDGSVGIATTTFSASGTALPSQGGVAPNNANAAVPVDGSGAARPNLQVSAHILVGAVFTFIAFKLM